MRHYGNVKYFPIPLPAQHLTTIQLLPASLHSFADLSQALEELANGVICMEGDVEMAVTCVLLTSQSMVPLNLL